MAFICGSFGNQEDDFEALWPFIPTPQKKTTRRHSFCSRSHKDSKNPYSNRGLDKFEALLADLDGKRQKIFTQKGSEDISLVRFVFSNSNDVKPIVVKIKDQRKQDKDQNHKTNVEKEKTTTESYAEHPKSTRNSKSGNGASIDLSKKKIINVGQLRKKFGEWWKPWYSLPVFLILIMVFLVFFGRSFAILCTSVGWYLVPSINATSKNPKRNKKILKKDYSRMLSDKIITSPRNILQNEPMNNQLPHRRSF